VVGLSEGGLRVMDVELQHALLELVDVRRDWIKVMVGRIQLYKARGLEGGLGKKSIIYLNTSFVWNEFVVESH
jgi:hypothetical protein